MRRTVSAVESAWGKNSFSVDAQSEVVVVGVGMADGTVGGASEEKIDLSVF